MKKPEILLTDLLAVDTWIQVLARRLVLHEDDAEDIAQETWLKALTHRPDRKGPIQRWMKAVAQNLARSRRRAEAHRSEREKEAATPESLPSVADLWDREQIRRSVAVAVFSLEEPYRSAILYRYFQNLLPREIAQRLEVSPAAVEGRLRRGLDQLRARLDREFGDRAHWSAALLPLLGAGPAGIAGAGSTVAGVASSAATGAGAATVSAAGSTVSVSLLTGALVMSTKIKIGIALLLAIGLAYAFWPQGGTEKTPAVSRETSDHAASPVVERTGKPESASPAVARAEPKTADGPPVETSGGIVPVPATVQFTSLQGTVQTETGKPVPDASLTIDIFNAANTEDRRRLPRSRTTKTDSKGHYAFECLHPELSLYLQVAATGYYRDTLLARAGDFQDIVLGVGGRLAGRVVDQEGGQPLSKAVVWAMNNSARGRHNRFGRKGEGDENGRFTIDDLRPGVYNLRAEAPDHLSDNRTQLHFVVQSHRTTEVELRLGRGMTLRGQVLDARGCSIAGARVGERHPLFTDAAGRFVLQGLSSSVRVRIEAPGKSPYHDWTRFLQTEIQSGSAERTFRLADAAILRGQVVDPDGRAVAGAGIRIRDDRPPIRADGEGRFEVALEKPGKTYRFAVLADGFAPLLLDPVKLAPGEIRDDLVVKLTRGGAIEGRVTTEDNAPIAGRTLLLRTWPELSKGLASVYRLTTSAADGRFRYEALAAGTYDIGANGITPLDPDQNFATRGRRCDIRVEEGKTLTGIVLVPTQRISLCGRTLDDRDRPLEGVRVVSWCGPSRALSDANGRFVLEGMPIDCPCSFEVSKEGYTFRSSRSTLPKTVQAGTPELVIRMVPIPPGIRGRVLRADTGAPVPFFWVRLHRVVQSDITHATRLQAKVRSHLPWFQDADGQFFFTRFYGPGEFAVDAGTEDGLVSESAVRARVEANAPAPMVELRLVPAATVRGRVLSPDATPIAGARVSAHDPETGRMLGTRNSYPHADGIYVIDRLPPGRVELRARHQDWYEVRTTIRVKSGRTIEQDLRLGREGAVLRIAVHDLMGKPVSGARLRLFTPLGEEVHPDMHKYDAWYAARFHAQGRTSFHSREYRHEIIQTNEEGRLERRFLPPGDYVVEASLKGYRPERRRVSVRMDTEIRVELTLTPEK